MASKHIEFKIGAENKPHVEKITKDVLSCSIFSEQYKYMLGAVNKYCSYNSIGGKDEGSKTAGHMNNIFTFLGDRGSGKTSCMLSVAETIGNLDDEVVEMLNIQELNKSSFLKLDMIDPSFFDNKHNILAIVIAKLYSKYQQLLNDMKANGKVPNHSKHMKLLGKFSEVQQNLLYLEHPQNPEDDNLNQLYLLAAAVSLKDNIYELITSFFDFFELKDYNLLLLIDDIDLNTQCADVMAEQIRKYFVQPNVVILMSLKLSQFELIKRMTFKTEYSALLSNDNSTSESAITHSDLNEMVERYITKLLPHAQRTYMPNPDNYMNLRLVIKNISGEETDYPTVKEAVPSLIFKKTRFLFYNSAQQISYIIPRNLRELRQLVSMLFNLEDYWDSEDEDSPKVHANKYNKDLFLNYLYENWCVSNLDTQDRKIIDFIKNIEDVSVINASIIDVLRSRFNSFFNESDSISSQDGINLELKAILSERNRTYNYSLGDTLTILYLLKARHTEEKHLKFIFILQTILSIRLYEAYDIYTDSLGSMSNINENDSAVQVSVMDNNRLKCNSDYHKLVGGRFFNNRLIDLLPKSERQVSRSNRRLPIGAINAIIDLAIETNNAKVIKLAEFFMLCTSRRFETRHSSLSNPDSYEYDFRRRGEISYSSKFGSTGSVLFDVNSFLFNVINIKDCYSRFDKGHIIYDKIAAGEWTDSVYTDFMKSTLRFRQGIDYPSNDNLSEFKLDRWASLASIRNVEIAMDLYGLLDSADYKSGNDSKILAEFFSKIARYSIDLYSGKAPNYQVCYPFAQTIADLLENAGQLFDYVYNDSRQESAAKINTFAVNLRDIYIQLQEGLENLNIEIVLKGMSPKRTYSTRSFKNRLVNHYRGSVQKDEYERIIDSSLSYYPDGVNNYERISIINRINQELTDFREMNDATD